MTKEKLPVRYTFNILSVHAFGQTLSTLRRTERVQITNEGGGGGGGGGGRIKCTKVPLCICLAVESNSGIYNRGVCAIKVSSTYGQLF